MSSILLPLLIVVATVAVFGFLALRRPVLFRMALRNALRRRAQTAVVVAGLMVGTAIIAGSIAAGDSIGFGIRQGAFEALGPTDEFVSIVGQLHFPAAVADDMAANATLLSHVRAVAPRLLENGAATARDLSSPQVAVVGFDPARDAPFGDFVLADGRHTTGSELGANDVFVEEQLADHLNVTAGDSLTLHYSVPRVPILPKIYNFTGTVTSAGAFPPADVPVPVPCVEPQDPAAPATFALPVAKGATRITAFLVWRGQTPADLDPAIVAPDGTRTANVNGTPNAPDVPAVVNVTAPADRHLAVGNWTFEVDAKAALNTGYRATVLVFYEVYDVNEVRNFTAALAASGFRGNFTQEVSGSLAETSNATLHVAGIVRDEGKGGFILQRNVFMRLDAAQALYHVNGKVNLVVVSNDANPELGADRTAEANTALNATLAAERHAHPDDPAVKELRVQSIKQRILAAADRAGDLFKQFLTTVGSFTVLAGIMLIVNIFIMLAEERKSELGMARAVGLQRRSLIELFTFEGLLYATVATLLGVLLGLALAAGLIFGINALLANAPGTSRALITLPFHPDAANLAWAGVAGFFLTLATIVFASWRASRLNIVRAIRRIEDPPRRAGRGELVAGVAFIAAGAAAGLAGIALDSLPLEIVGPCLAILGLAMVASRFLPKRLAYPLGGAAVAAYSIWTIFALPNPNGTLNRLMGPLRGAIVVVAIVLVVVHIPQLPRLAKRLLLAVRSLVAAAKPGVAYPLEKRGRTGLTVAMFALVILVVVAFSIFSATFTVDLKSQSGGYDIEGDTTLPVTNLETWWASHHATGAADPFRLIARHDDLVYGELFGGDAVRINGQKVNYPRGPDDVFYTYGENFARTNRYDFVERAPQYTSDADAYLAVLHDPSLVIVSAEYTFDDTGQPGAHHVGETLTLKLGGSTTNFTIIGIQKQIFLGGIFVHPSVVQTDFQHTRGDYLFVVKPGVDAKVTAKELEKSFKDLGMDAQSIEEVAAQQLQESRRFFTLFEVFLAFGLIVGIASLGIVTARSVIERRQEIGMLRAIGYPRREILKVFLIEILFVTTLGVLIGSVTGIVLAYGVTETSSAVKSLGIVFRVPWTDLATIIGLTYLAVLGATWWPARAGSRIPPAEAVRYIE